MEFVLTWIFCAVAALDIAVSKNRSTGGWFFLGLIFGPLALIVAALPKLSNKTTSASGEELSDSPTKKCPECAETIKFEAIKCRYCGYRFVPEQTNQSVETAKEISTEMQILRNDEGADGRNKFFLTAIICLFIIISTILAIEEHWFG